MSIDNNVQTVKDFFAAIGKGDREAVFALVSEDIEWVIPGDSWPLAGTHRGYAGLTALFEKASGEIETNYPQPPEYFADGDRVFQVGLAKGTIKDTGRPFEDHFVFVITVKHDKLTAIREYVDTQALARAASADAHNPNRRESDV